jgi:hypothetical protein
MAERTKDPIKKGQEPFHQEGNIRYYPQTARLVEIQKDGSEKPYDAAGASERVLEAVRDYLS